MHTNEIFKRDEEVMSKELETLSQQIEMVTNNTAQLQTEYDKLTNKMGHFHKENVIDLRLIQNFDEGVLNLEVQSSMEIETIIITAQFDFEVLLDEQLYVFYSNFRNDETNVLGAEKQNKDIDN